MFLYALRPRLTYRSRLASAQCLQDRYFVAGAHRVAQGAPVANQALADENVDVRAQAATFVAQIKADARRSRFERTHHTGHVGGFDFEHLPVELREVGEQMPCELDLHHGAEGGTRRRRWQRMEG